MPNFFTGEPTRDELQEQIARLEATNASLTATNRNLNSQIGEMQQRQEVVGRIATQAEAALEEAERANAEGSHVIIWAEQEALNVLKARLFVEKAEPIRDSLIAEKGDEFTILYGAEWTTQLREQLDEQFTNDGTYRDLERSIKAAAIQRTTDDLLADKKADIEARLSTPESQAEIEAAARERATNSNTLANYEEQRRRELEAGWQETAIADAKKKVNDNIAAEEPEFKKRVTDDWLNSPAGQNFRKAQRKEAQTALKDLTLAELAELVKDEELMAAATELAAHKKAEALASLKNKIFIEGFMNGGIDTTAIPADTIMTIQLGDVGKSENPKYDKWQVDHNYSQEPKTVKSLKITREFTLLSRGDGTFLVQKDSLTDSTDEYVRDSAIVNTVIIIGRQVKDNTAKEVRIEQKLSQGNTLFFDDDTSTPNIQSARYPVVNIMIGDQEAMADITTREFVNR